MPLFYSLPFVFSELKRSFSHMFMSPMLPSNIMSLPYTYLHACMRIYFLTDIHNPNFVFLDSVNMAADPIVTRWKRSNTGSIVERDGLRVLEFVCIKRKDGNKDWAIPGRSPHYFIRL